MFKFFKEVDEENYNKIIKEVEHNICNDTCFPSIQTRVEVILKNIHDDSGVIIYNKKEFVMNSFFFIKFHLNNNSKIFKTI